MSSMIKDRSLYLVVSEEYGCGKTSVEIAKLAIAGGVDILQMREKNKTREELIALASKLSVLCKENDMPFIVNDDPEIARECGATGVHLGQEDVLKYSIARTRSILGEDKIIGVSTHSIPELLKANEQDVDYIAYGPIFHTKTKDYFIGTGDIKEAVRASKKPLVFIGGINLLNVDEVLRLGTGSIAVIRSIVESEDIAESVRAFKARIER